MMTAVSIGLLFGGYIVLFFCVVRLIRKYQDLHKWGSDLSIDFQLHESQYEGLSDFCMEHIGRHE